MKKSELRNLIHEIYGERDKVIKESPLEKNLLKNISKILIKRNPNIDKVKILSTVKSWLDKDKNLIIAINAMGDDYERDVLRSIESELEILKEEI
jgi:hypothetical protein